MNTEKIISQSETYKELILDIKSKVRSAQIKAARAVNTELLSLYWEIGKTISLRQIENSWGDGVVRQIAADIERELDGARGFSARNIYFIQQWYHFYRGIKAKFVKQLVSQIPWGHNILIIQKIKDVKQAIWYVQKTLENNWSRNVFGPTD